MIPSRRVIATLLGLAWIVVAAQATAVPPVALVWKKGSDGRGEKISLRELVQFTTRTSKPSYQNDERLRKFTGTGIFDLRIDPSSGETTGIRIFKSTGHYELDLSAVKALINWRFKPGTLVRAVFPLRFVRVEIRGLVTPEYFLRPGP
jgi:TonB family protein